MPNTIKLSKIMDGSIYLRANMETKDEDSVFG
jgi:hypothetical protein